MLVIVISCSRSGSSGLSDGYIILIAIFIIAGFAGLSYGGFMFFIKRGVKKEI
jgi:hypothetical protein